MIQPVLQNCIIQEQDAAPLFHNDFLEIYLGPQSNEEDDAKDSRG